MKSPLSISIVLSTILLVSCAAPGVPYETFKSSLAPIPEDQGRLFVYRLEGEGERVSTAVRSNGEPIGRAVPGSFFLTDLTIGPYILSATKNTDRTLTVHVSEGETQFIRVDIVLRAMRYDWDLTLVPEEQAIQELQGTVNTEG